MEPDYSKMSDAELDAELSKYKSQSSPAQEPGLISKGITEFSNATTAASQGLIQGVGNLQDNVVLLFRDITDSMGYTDPAYSAKIRQDMADSTEVTAAAAKKLGYEHVSKGFELIGEYGPQMALGGAVFKGAKSLLGAGRVADVAANAVSGGVTGLLTDSGGEPGGRLESAATGAALGGLIGGITNTVGKVKDKFYSLSKDKLKEEAFRAAGIKPTASQLADDLNPMMKARLENVELDLNRMPGIGITGRINKQPYQVRDYLERTVKELDEGLPDPGLKFENIKLRLSSSGIQDTSKIANVAKTNFEALTNARGVKISKDTLGILDDIAKKPPQTFNEIHDLRRNLDDQINAMKGSLGTKQADSEFRALAKLRHSLSDSLDDIAFKNGWGPAWKAANIEYQDQLYKKSFADAFQNAFENKGGAFRDEGAKFNLKKFTSNWNQARSDLKELRLEPPKKYQKALTAIGRVANTLASSPLKPGPRGVISKVNSLGLGGGIAATVGAPLYAGLGLLAKTQYGIELLSTMSTKSLKSPAVRSILTTALALGNAAQQKQSQEREINTYRAMSDEQLDAELAKYSQQTGAQQ